MGSVGKPIAVGDVVSKSAAMISQNPTLMVPQVIILVLALLGDVLSRSSLSALGIVTTLVSFAASAVIAGAYPSMVQTLLEGGQFSVSASLRRAYERFWTLLLAGIAVGLVVVLGFVAFIVPGIVIATWYAYTVPAIMLENKGALAGMGTSKAFGRDKKWSTFLLFVYAVVAAIVILLIETLLSFASPMLGRVIDSILFVPLDAWVAVVFTYTYLTYGPSSVRLTAEASAPGAMPTEVFQEPSVQADARTSAVPQKSFCKYCGSPAEPNSRFCGACGKAI
jgi:hypothetical protein